MSPPESDKPRKPDRTGRDEPAKPQPEARDQLFVHGLSEGGRVAHVIRTRADRLEAGMLRPVEEGRPISGDLVELRRRAESPLLFDVIDKYRSPVSRASKRKRRAGPPQVATRAYETGWEAIWGGEPDEEGEETIH